MWLTPRRHSFPSSTLLPLSFVGHGSLSELRFTIAIILNFYIAVWMTFSTVCMACEEIFVNCLASAPWISFERAVIQCRTDLSRTEMTIQYARNVAMLTQQCRLGLCGVSWNLFGSIVTAHGFVHSWIHLFGVEIVWHQLQCEHGPHNLRGFGESPTFCL